MSVRDAEELKKISAFVQACRKVSPTVHKLDARALVKISRLPWKDLSFSLSLSLSLHAATRNIFPPSWQPRFNRPKKLWRHRLLGTSVYASVYTSWRCYQGTGFRTGSRYGSRKLRETRTNHWSLENFVNDGWSWTLRFLYKSIDVEFIFIYSCLLVAYF